MIWPKKMRQILGMLIKFNLTKNKESDSWNARKYHYEPREKPLDTHMFLRMLIVKVRIAATGLESNER